MLLSSIGHPLSQCTIQQKVKVLSGVMAHRTWVKGFLTQHPSVILGKPSALDLKCCQSFTCTIIKHHFDPLKDILNKKEIPWENIYNMDKKGCQLGSG